MTTMNRLPQDRLRLLQALYNRRVADIAAVAGLQPSNTSDYLNCRKVASPTLVARIEAAIVRGPQHAKTQGRDDRWNDNGTAGSSPARRRANARPAEYGDSRQLSKRVDECRDIPGEAVGSP